jgi:TPR repeat protein
MKWLVIAIALVGCRKGEDEAQAKLDRQIEEMGGIHRDKSGRPYKDPPPSRRPAPPARPEIDPANCKQGDLAACAIADALGDYPTALRQFQKACDAKMLAGCGHLATMLRHGHGIPEDRKRAETLARQGCDAGDGYSCYELGITRETSSAPTPPADVIALYDKACTAGAEEGCSELGMVYHSGRGGAPHDDAKAASYLQKACDLGDHTSCLQVDMVRPR